MKRAEGESMTDLSTSPFAKTFVVMESASLRPSLHFAYAWLYVMWY